jgi:thioredoxin reductase
MELYDVIIIGGGPAGLNAAVVLGRCRRKVLLFDHGKQRNLKSHGMHNYLTRDDIKPLQFLEAARKEIKKYGVTLKSVAVNNADKKNENYFTVTDINRKNYHSKKLILATGLKDKLPAIPGAAALYGNSMYHCPYCDGWEVADKKLAVYSKPKGGVELALTLTCFSNNITLFTDGKKYMRKSDKNILDKKNIKVISTPIKSFEGKNGKLKNITLVNGEKHMADALFFSGGYEVQCGLVESLGCTMGKDSLALTNKSQQTNIKGLYVAGDASKDMHFVVVAAAEGAKAAVYVNKELMSEENKKKPFG